MEFTSENIEKIDEVASHLYFRAAHTTIGKWLKNFKEEDRETALLGVPAYYLGIRYGMPANAAASKVASLQNQKTMAFEEWIAQIADAKTTATERSAEQDA